MDNQRAVMAAHNPVTELTYGKEFKTPQHGSHQLDSDPGAETASGESTQLGEYIRGIRLYGITLALCLALFLTNMEVPIVSTSLVSITNDLLGFRQSSWIVTGYLLSYISFLIISAKLSDVFGRKSTTLVAIVVFVAFSAACGAAQTMTQLIVFRALQGIGGSGIYSVCQTILFELVPAAEYPRYAMIVSVAFTLSLLLGPILGGAINDSNQWRWVFLLNVPAGLIAGALLLLLLPTGFPYHSGLSTSAVRTAFSTKSADISSPRKTGTLRRLDVLGAMMMLVATVLMISAFEEAGVRFAWKSPFVIVFLTVSGLLWIAFLLWERTLTLKSGVCEPVFPWRFMKRDFIGMILNAFFLGAPFTVAIFLIPQRYIVVNNISPLGAGIRLVPFTLFCPIGSILASIVAKRKVPPIYILMVGSAFQVLGFGLLTTLPIHQAIMAAQYGYQIIAGFGTGINISTLILMTPFFVEDRDKAVAISAINQFRYLGGAIALSVVASVLNHFMYSRLSQFLSVDQVSALLQSSKVVTTYSLELQEEIRQVFGHGYNIQIKILVCISAAQLPCSFIMWRRKQIIVQG